MQPSLPAARLLLRCLVASMMAAAASGCHADPTGLEPPDTEALAASLRFRQIADSLGGAGADPMLVRSYRAIASSLFTHQRVSAVHIVVDGADEEWLATGRELGLPAFPCPAGALCEASIPELVSIVAWQRADPRRVIQLTAPRNSGPFGEPVFYGPGAPFLDAAGLAYLDGRGGVYLATSGTRSIEVTHTDRPCAEGLHPSTYVETPAPIPTICTVAGMRTSFSGTLQPATLFGARANTATGAHAVVMSPQEVEGARVEIQPCAGCLSAGYPLVLLPPVNLRGTTVLPSSLRVSADSVVTMTLTVSNPTTAPVELRFNDSQQYDFVIRAPAGARPVWRWGADRMFAQSLTTRVLAPGEQWAITETWRPTVRGPLIVEGLLTSTSHYVLATSSVVVP